ncbi:MAG: NAD(P)H-dependent oxidoreductase [Pseudomonadota bacterium]
MKVLAFAASNHSQSINRALVGYASARLQQLAPATQIEFLDINEYEMPIYSLDRERADGVHPLARQFFETIGSADALIVSFAEYNGYVTSAWKNIYDWMSRIDQKVWQDKPFVLLAASPGPRAGASVLQTQEQTAPFFGMDIKGRYGVGSWSDAWDGRTLINDADVAGIDAAVKGLLA